MDAVPAVVDPYERGLEIVVPAKAGIQCRRAQRLQDVCSRVMQTKHHTLDPRVRGDDTGKFQCERR